jgi:hypothetical protein
MDDTAPAPPTPRRFVPLALIALALAAASWACSTSLESRLTELSDTRTDIGIPVSVPADRITEPQDTLDAPTPAGEVPSADASAAGSPPAPTPSIEAPPNGLTDAASPSDEPADAPHHSSANGPSVNANANAHGPGGVSDSHASPSSRH